MIQITKGNLLKANVEALVNTVNTVGVMGKGIALQFKQAYPENFKQYQAACKQKKIHPGKMFTVPISLIENPKYIINFPTKRHWRSKSKIEDIALGLNDLRAVIINENIKSVAIPPLGCGNGGLNWDEVKPLILNKLGGLDGVEIFIYEPDGAPSPDDIIVNTDKPKMTKARALLILIMKEYLKPGYKLSLLEIQKLSYFLQEIGEPLNLRFEKNKYGPYAENLNHVLIRMEGHFIRGYGDRSRDAQVYLINNSDKEAKDFIKKEFPPAEELLKKIKNFIRGFETPYGLELLSTVHWVIKENPELVNKPDKVIEIIQNWNTRKKELFKSNQIKKTLQHIVENNELIYK
ncbi:macro domain-containing protein [Bacillus licheniformis]|uniref:type II toxin-antitoxin system antitoxin DNA ADP-ribosyl glycohydrolase DarG n=1 Tax=Bacillus licheniformis TaxID=1402 RepID=UPI0009494F86|nr:macro domain-containing protein [Bacillus licheniformis]MEC5253431.1 macro domain-containing protein [Bacillus licheniformis]MED4305815.1 macro domain-containing protein [Bacillus licheniformis]OLF93916.1 ADP-ribose 1-phosphate phophatase related protein [Bacillus licheniformis]